MLNSVRTRLAIWHVGILAVVLVSFSLGVYLVLSHTLYQRLDDNLRTTATDTGLSLSNAIRDGVPVATAATDALSEHIGPHQAAAIFDTEGRLIVENKALGNIRAPIPHLRPIPTADLYTLSENSTGPRRVAVQGVMADGKSYVIVVSNPFESITRELRVIRLVLYMSISVALLLSGFGGWFLARRSLAPLVEMMERARQISAENLAQRLPVANPKDELGRLATTFNELLVRLDESFAQQRRFVADASHELRTPLSVIRTATGVTLELKGRDEAEYREALKMVDEEARRLTHVVDDMFTLALVDSGHSSLNASNFHLNELISETVRAAEVLGAKKEVGVHVDPLAETPYRGDEGLLRQLLLNLLDNAIRHTLPHRVVRMKLKSNGWEHQIVVSDAGAGIPIEAQPFIFERFFRVDKARSRAEPAGGAGLGLSIAKWIAEAHGGTLKLLRSDDTGSTFVASLPFNNSHHSDSPA
jgi:two-component system OmpR family sensor kinase